mgnify:CR=1 FL=1
MRKLYAKPVIIFSDSVVTTVLPDFKKDHGYKKPDQFSPVAVYKLGLDKQLWFYLLLEFHKHDTFSFSVGWSIEDKVPHYSDFQAMNSAPFGAVPANGNFLKHLGLFYCNSSIEYNTHPPYTSIKRDADGSPDKVDLNRWMRHEFTEEEYMPYIRGGINDGIRMFAEYALPYLESVSEYYSVPIKIQSKMGAIDDSGTRLDFFAGAPKQIGLRALPISDSKS